MAAVDVPSSSTDSSEAIHFVIIGAGPVGLWTAIQIKILLPKVEINIFERYEEYRRHHVLRLSKSSLMRAVPHPKLQKLIDKIHKTIRTSVLENELKTIALELGIKIIHEAVDDIDRVLNSYAPSSVTAVIGADGAHSLIRKQIFKDKFAHQEALKYIVELKYEVKGGEHARIMKFANEFYPTQKLLDFSVVETVGECDPGRLRTPVTIRFVVSRLIYMAMREATFKNPFMLASDKHRIPEALYQAITIWLNAREYCTGEERVAGSEKVSALHLSVYRADRVAMYDETREVAFCLVGDAAFGVPFYRALNNGLICGSKLAVCLADYMKQSLGSESVGQYHRENSSGQFRFGIFKTLNAIHRVIAEGSINAYDNFVNTLAVMEIGVAKTKSDYLFASKWINRVNAAVPWQVNRWDEQRIKSFKSDLFPLNYADKVAFIQVPPSTSPDDSICSFESIDWQGPSDLFDAESDTLIDTDDENRGSSEGEQD